jgi:hypothetical protein
LKDAEVTSGVPNGATVWGEALERRATPQADVIDATTDRLNDFKRPLQWTRPLRVPGNAVIPTQPGDFHPDVLLIAICTALIGAFTLLRLQTALRQRPDGPDLPRAMAERRKEPRRRTTFRYGVLYEHDGAMLGSCLIKDRSKTGARLKYFASLPVGTDVLLLDTEECILYAGKVVWSGDSQCGLSLRRLRFVRLRVADGEFARASARVPHAVGRHRSC